MPIKRTLTIELAGTEVEVSWEDAEALLTDLAEALGKSVGPSGRHIVSEASVIHPKTIDPNLESYPMSDLGRRLEGHTEGQSGWGSSELASTGRGSPMTYDKGVPPAKRGVMAEAVTDEELSPELKASIEAYYQTHPGGGGEAPWPMPDDEWGALRAARQGHAPGFNSDVGSSPGGSDKQRSG